MKKFLLNTCVWLFLFAAADVPALQPPPVPILLPGLRPDGSLLLPNQWSLRPAGQQVLLGDFPVNIAVHPEGRYAAILHCGHGPHEIVVVDVKQAVVVSRAKVNEAFYGLEFSNAGGRLYCSGASDEVVHVFDFHEGQLTELEAIPLRDAKQRGIPCGLALSGDAQRLFVANVWGQQVSQIDLFARTNSLDLALGPGGAGKNATTKFEPVASVDPDLAAITKRDEVQLDPSSPEAPFPYACRLDEEHQRLFVSLWAQSCVAVIDLRSHEVVARWATGEHPNEMILTKSGRHLLVANANHNTVTIIDTSLGQTVETLDAAFSPAMLPGSTPMSLALSPDEKTLFVANACNNNVAVFDLSVIGRSHSLGFIPVGWYPTSVRVTPDGRKLLVANGKGLMSKPILRGPQPTKARMPDGQTISELFTGWLSIIDLPRGKQFENQLAAYTAQAYLCTPDNTVPKAQPGTNNPVPAVPGQASPIKYCVYIVKENRTYDQVLGDMARGNGDSNLCIFPEHVTPNHHKLADEFVLLDNFYVDAEVSADGHEWSMGAYASDFVEKTWPLNYGHGKSKKFPYPAEGKFPVAAPAGGYLWDRAREAGVSYRSYGEFTINGRTPELPCTTKIASLQGHFDPLYHGFDTDYPDAKRADRFIAELKRFETEGGMPRLQIVRLPNDHTAGAVAGKLAVTSLLADNDLALGRVVEALSRSKFWPELAIFVLEDDAQNGPDHVDAHRSPAFVISPYTRHHAVDSTMYSTSSMLRTIELLLGLKAMSQFDAVAIPMFNAFQAVPDLRPYQAAPANVDLNVRNTRLAWGSDASSKMDFTREDAADDSLLNEIVWRSVRGAASPMPAPTHAAFVFTRKKTVDDD